MYILIYGHSCTLIGRRSLCCCRQMCSRAWKHWFCHVSRSYILNAPHICIIKSLLTYGYVAFLQCWSSRQLIAPLEGLSPNDSEAVIDIDVLGTFKYCQGNHPYFLKSKDPRIIYVSATLTTPDSLQLMLPPPRPPLTLFVLCRTQVWPS